MDVSALQLKMQATDFSTHPDSVYEEGEDYIFFYPLTPCSRHGASLPTEGNQCVACEVERERHSNIDKGNNKSNQILGIKRRRRRA